MNQSTRIVFKGVISCVGFIYLIAKFGYLSWSRLWDRFCLSHTSNAEQNFTQKFPFKNIHWYKKNTGRVTSLWERNKLLWTHFSYIWNGRMIFSMFWNWSFKFTICGKQFNEFDTFKRASRHWCLIAFGLVFRPSAYPWSTQMHWNFNPCEWYRLNPIHDRDIFRPVIIAMASLSYTFTMKIKTTMNWKYQSV